MTMKKKGISDIVVTILIILLALAAIVIVWQVVKKMTAEKAEDIEIESLSVNLQLVNLKGNVFSVERKPGKGDLSKVKFILQKEDGNSVSIEKDTDIKELETKTFDLTTDLPVGTTMPDFKKVTIVPVLSSGNLGKLTASKDLVKYCGPTCEEQTIIGDCVGETRKAESCEVSCTKGIYADGGVRLNGIRAYCGDNVASSLEQCNAALGGEVCQWNDEYHDCYAKASSCEVLSSVACEELATSVPPDGGHYCNFASCKDTSASCINLNADGDCTDPCEIMAKLA